MEGNLCGMQVYLHTSAHASSECSFLASLLQIPINPQHLLWCKLT